MFEKKQYTYTIISNCIYWAAIIAHMFSIRLLVITIKIYFYLKTVDIIYAVRIFRLQSSPLEVNRNVSIFVFFPDAPHTTAYTKWVNGVNE